MHFRKFLGLALVFGGISGQPLFAQNTNNIKEDASITKMRRLRMEERTSESYKLEGYRIFVQIFSNRRDAIKFQKEFNFRFDGQAACQIIYDEPNFKIYAGTYVLKAEAEAILHRVRQAYPTAKIIKMPIPHEFSTTSN